jgi:signal transduction histidine kinase
MGSLRHHGGRVIALGRALLAYLFLFALWVDASQPSQAPQQTFILLLGYIGVSCALVAIVWNDWWLDAKLAAPTHILDILIFTLLVFSTEGYTSPFFLFFTFILFSAAIRWGWRETALTAVALIALYAGMGLANAVESNGAFRYDRFIVRAGHLTILSCLLIWFGVHQGLSTWAARGGGIADLNADEPLLNSVLIAAANRARARKGALDWRDPDGTGVSRLRFLDGAISTNETAQSLLREHGGAPFLYDLKQDRSLRRLANRQPVFATASDVIDLEGARAAGLKEGLAIPVDSHRGEGVLFLEKIDGLSIDHIELAELISRDVADRIRQQDLLNAMEETAEAGARLKIARDLHDSIVQFLAGAAFRIEAMSRRVNSGGEVREDLAELKRLMLEEQADLRAFIEALRSGQEVEIETLAAQLQTLSRKLGQQWNIACRFSADTAARPVPARLLIDAQQLMRESVANAVRHGKASNVDIRVSAGPRWFCLRLVDDGIGMQPSAQGELGEPQHPRSLHERVSEAGGELRLRSLSSGTRVTIMLPIGKAA